jgi:hypothetical protein
MSNPTVSFRISDYHLARGLRAIRILDPNWQLTTPAELIRALFNDYIAKLEFSNNCPLSVTPELLQEIALARTGMTKQPELNKNYAPLPQVGQSNKPAWKVQQELEQEKIFNAIKQQSQPMAEKDLDNQINLAFQTTRPLPKPSEFQDPNNTESKITTVTDFSPPKDWID